MNSKRTPFQFTSIDPAKRQAELRKRFGLPSNDMIFDFMNSPRSMGGSGLASESPRMQHRVPVFDHGSEKTSNGVDGHKPKVRVIPIQVEGVDGPVTRHKTFSGPAGSPSNVEVKKENVLPEAKMFCNDSSNRTVDIEQPRKPKVCNIPIQIESRDTVYEPKAAKPRDKPKSDIQTKVKSSKPVREIKVEKVNGCAASCEKPQGPDKTIPFKQIETVLKKLESYHKEVLEFTGSAKDKQYRYLDEMLTRCMLDLDDVDTLGLDEVRQSRKAAVKKVQASIDLLEEKISMPVDQDTKESSVNEASGDMEMKDEIADSKIETSDPEDSEIKDTNVELAPGDVEMTEESQPSTNIESIMQKDKEMEVVKTVVQDIDVESNIPSNAIQNSDVPEDSEILSSETVLVSNLENPDVEMNSEAEHSYETKSVIQDASVQELEQGEVTRQTVIDQDNVINELPEELANSSSEKMNVEMDKQSENETNSVVIQEIESTNDEGHVMPSVTEYSDSNETVKITEPDERNSLDLPLIEESDVENLDNIEISKLK